MCVCVIWFALIFRPGSVFVKTDLYLRLLCWQLSEGGGGAGRVWAASDAADL